MATAYIDSIDITPDGKLTVAGSLSRTGLRAVLSERQYIVPPADGIWEYDLAVDVESALGATMLVPFSAQAPWTGDSRSRGARVYQNDAGELKATTQLKVALVDEHTSSQQNAVFIDGASLDASASNLVVDLRYSGGCFPHSFELQWDGTILKSNPPQYVLNLVDTSPHDPCKAVIPQQVRFDVTTPQLRLERGTVVHLRTPSGGQVRLDLK